MCFLGWGVGSAGNFAHRPGFEPSSLRWQRNVLSIAPPDRVVRGRRFGVSQYGNHMHQNFFEREKTDVTHVSKITCFNGYSKTSGRMTNEKKNSSLTKALTSFFFCYNEGPITLTCIIWSHSTARLMLQERAQRKMWWSPKSNVFIWSLRCGDAFVSSIWFYILYLCRMDVSVALLTSFNMQDFLRKSRRTRTSNCSRKWWPINIARLLWTVQEAE